MKYRNILAAAAMLASVVFIGGTANAQDVVVVDHTCTYNEAIAGVCDLDRTIYMVDLLPGDGMADWFTTYGGLDVGCVNFGFEQTLCTPVTFTRGNGVSCVVYPTFTHCQADAEPVTPEQVIVIVPADSECVVDTDGRIVCAPKATPTPDPGPAPDTIPAPQPAFTG